MFLYIINVNLIEIIGQADSTLTNQDYRIVNTTGERKLIMKIVNYIMYSYAVPIEWTMNMFSHYVVPEGGGGDYQTKYGLLHPGYPFPDGLVLGLWTS